MAQHKFKCRGCRKLLGIPKEQIGKAVTCPYCQTDIAVPTRAEDAAYAEELRRRKKADAEKARLKAATDHERKRAEAAIHSAQEKTEREQAAAETESEQHRQREKLEEARRFVDSQIKTVDVRRIDQRPEVVVTDIRIPFWSMVMFMVTWGVAAVPAMIIVGIIGAGLFAILGALAAINW